MLHPERPSQGCVCFDDYIVLLAKGGYLGACIEGVHLDLVDRGMDSRFGCQKLLQLMCVLAEQKMSTGCQPTCFTPKLLTPADFTSPS